MKDIFIMKQQCPKCGNWVEGHAQQDFKRKATDSVVKKSAGALIGAAVGTVFAPGIGTALGGAVGDFLLSGEIDKASNKANEMLYGEANYEFVCPNCNYRWIGQGEGTEVNLVTKEQYIFTQEYEYFVEHAEEIGSSEETLKAYISKLESIQLTCDVPKSEICFLIAWVAYIATEDYPNYLSIANNYIYKALRLLNDEEYRLFALMVENKQGNRNAEKITREALALFKNLKSDNMLLKEEYYRDELNDAIQETLHQYKKQKLDENRKCLIKNSLWCVPILLFFVFKYSIYEPSGIWLFSWAPIYIFILILVGLVYFQVIAKYHKETSRTNEEWLGIMTFDFVGFNWKDLFK